MVQEIDVGEPLENPRREKFAALVASGANQLTAFREAGYCPTGNDKTAAINACRLAASPDVSARIKQLQRAVSTERVLSMAERRATLAAIVRTPATRFLKLDWSNEQAVRDLGPAAHAIKGLKLKSYTGDNGHMVAEADLDMYDKISAIREDAILAGERRTDGTQVTFQQLNIGTVLAALNPQQGPSQAFGSPLGSDEYLGMPHAEKVAQDGSMSQDSGPLQG